MNPAPLPSPLTSVAPEQPTGFGERLVGHRQTLAPFFERKLRTSRPPTLAWSTELSDPEAGSVRLSGSYLPGASESLLVVVHGLGGHVESGYMALALRAAHRAGRRCLLLNLRGADRSGQDIHHAGLVDDIRAALESPVARDVPTIDLLGYSLGGHTVLKYAVGEVDPRLRRVAAISSPLLLDRSADAFDAPKISVYRRHVLESLYEIYTAAFQRRPGGLSPLEARKIKKIREWDDKIVAPRFGFASAQDYYEKVSVGPALGELKRDALYIGAPFDPMVPRNAVVPALPAPRLTQIWDPRGGHLGFPDAFDLGLGGDAGVEAQVLRWMDQG